MQNDSKIESLFRFLTNAEKLKTVLRHSWTSDISRQESVAEHTWMMSLFALLLIAEVEQSVDPLKVLKMIVVHDLAESLTGDIPIHESSLRHTDKAKLESEALAQLVSILPNQEVGEEITTLWQMFEVQESAEAHFVKMLDALDVIWQHYLADLDSWDDHDYMWAISTEQDQYFNIDPMLRRLKDQLNHAIVTKIRTADQQYRMKQSDLAQWEQKARSSHAA